MNAINEIKKIQAQQEDLTDAMNEAAEKAFPVRSIVNFYKGSGWRSVEILCMNKAFGRGGDPAFKVKNIHTGSEYYVGLYWLMNTNPA